MSDAQRGEIWSALLGVVPIRDGVLRPGEVGAAVNVYGRAIGTKEFLADVIDQLRAWGFELRGVEDLQLTSDAIKEFVVGEEFMALTSHIERGESNLLFGEFHAYLDGDG